MDFDLTKEQKDIKKAAGEFAAGEFDPDAVLEWDRRHEFPFPVWEKACELGFMGMHFPEQYSGQELGFLENVLITEEFCRRDSGTGIALAVSDFGSDIVLRHGDERQKKDILPSIAGGETLFSMAFLEDGYSLSPMATTARTNQEGWVLNGKKRFVTLGRHAKKIIVACQTREDDPFAQSLFLVDAGATGVDLSPMGEKVGMRMVPTDHLVLAGVVVRKEDRIGGKDRGYDQIRDFFNEMRIETAAMGIGIAQGSLDMALEYSKKREQFGKPIANFDAVRNRLSDMYVDVEMSRLVVYKAALSADNGRPDSGALLMSKMVASKTAYRVSNDALQIFGGLGYMKEGHIERFYRDARALESFMEPVQTQRKMIADQILGAKI